MQRQKLRSQHFVGVEQMPYIGSGEIFAKIAAAFLIYRAQVLGKAGITQIQLSPACKGISCSSIARRDYAVEHVCTVSNTLKNIFRRSHAHNIFWFAIR